MGADQPTLGPQPGPLLFEECATHAAGSALKGEFEGLRRLLVSHYRVVYEWQRSELLILLVRIGHRREVYR